MADKSIVELGIAQQMTDDALLPVYQGGETKSIEGALIKKYARDSVKVYTDAAREHADAAEANKNAAAQSAAKAEENADRTAADVEVVKSAADAERERVAAEDVRRTAETSRETEEGKRAAAEGIRATSETARREAEEGRKTEEQTRVDNETARGVSEADRAAKEAQRVKDETARKGAETKRANAETSRATAETGRETAEADRVEKEAGRVAEEGKRATTERTRDTNEEKRRAAETDRAAKEAERRTAEEQRVSGEAGRVESEAERQAKETERQQTEAGRVTAETGRVDAETLRGQGEQARGSAEALRVNAETKRATAETGRTQAEQGRVDSETQRVAAESTRAEQETRREAGEAARNVWEAYDPAKTYQPLNKVAYNGSSYICTAASTGNAPTDTAHWLMIAAKGKDGEGAGDMTASVYDPQGKSTDAFQYADDAVEKHVLTATREVYVSNAGSDETGDGTMANPWATIQKAVDEAPEECGAFTYAIYLRSGTYAGFVLNGKAVQLNRQNGDVVMTSMITVTNGAYMKMPFSVVFSPSSPKTGLTVSRFGVACVGSITFNGCANGINVFDGGQLAAPSGTELAINNCTSSGVNVRSGGYAKVGNIIGAGNNQNISVDGGIISYSSYTASPSTEPDQAINGGIITNNLLDVSQKGAPGGLATLDENGKVFWGQLPAISADDVPFADGETFQQKLDAGKLKGADGTKGTNGKSAYQQAVDAGYTGTEAAFYAALVSLKDAPFLPIIGGVMAGNIMWECGAGIGIDPMNQEPNIQLVSGPDDNTPVELANIAVPTYAKAAANKEYVDGKALVFTGKTVAASAWLSNTTYSAQGYAYRASVACAGVTTSHRPDVAFGAADAVGGNFAPISESYAGGVYIYCKEKPTATITIPSIVCIKGA